MKRNACQKKPEKKPPLSWKETLPYEMNLLTVHNNLTINRLPFGAKSCKIEL
jgi:hypothetical protein